MIEYPKHIIDRYIEKDESGRYIVRRGKTINYYCCDLIAKRLKELNNE